MSLERGRRGHPAVDIEHTALMYYNSAWYIIKQVIPVDKSVYKLSTGNLLAIPTRLLYTGLSEAQSNFIKLSSVTH